MSLRDKCRQHRVLVCVVSGKIGAGKTTLCDGLVASLGGHNVVGKESAVVLVRNFADRLKEIVALHLDIDLSMTQTHQGKNTILPAYDNASIGTMLQQVGSKLREVHPLFWINAVESWLEARIDERVSAANTASSVQKDARKDAKEENESKDSLPFNMLVLIGDGRFPNEVEWVKERCGGMSIRLNGDPGGERARSTRDKTHISETALDAYDAFDLVLSTDGGNTPQSTLREAEQAIVYFAKQLFNV